MRVFVFMKGLHQNVFLLIADNFKFVNGIFSVLVLKTRTLQASFFFFCLFSNKVRVYVFKCRKVSTHATDPSVCDVFCQPKNNLYFETRILSQRIL